MTDTLNTQPQAPGLPVGYDPNTGIAPSTATPAPSAPPVQDIPAPVVTAMPVAAPAPAPTTPAPSQGVPMLDNTGKPVYVPAENVQKAISQGGYKLSVNMTGSDGSKVHIPFDQQDAAQKDSANTGIKYTWDADEDNAALKQYITQQQDPTGLKAKYGLPPSADLSKGYLDPANAEVKDPAAFSKAYQEANPPKDQTILQKTGAVISNVLKPWEGAQAPTTVEELLSPFEMLAGEAGGELLEPYVSKLKALLPHGAEPEPGAITEGPFTQATHKDIPQGPNPMHGNPVETPQPLDNATITKQAGGKDLTTDEMAALRRHAGATTADPAEQIIEPGSTPKNILHKAGASVQNELQSSQTALNQVVNDAPPFKTSVTEDGDYAQQIAATKAKLPNSIRASSSADIDEVVADGQKALDSHDPAELQAYKRSLGQSIDDWNPPKTPTTASDAINRAKVDQYFALSKKLHEISATVPLDKTVTQDLHLQKFLVKNGVDLDPVQSNSEYLSEFKKGQNTLSVKAQNAAHKAAVDIHNSAVTKNFIKVGTAISALSAGAAAAWHKVSQFIPG